MGISDRIGGTAATPRYRQLILALIAIGAVGLAFELLLLEHFEDPWQWAPIIALGMVLVTVGVVAARPTRGALRLFQLVMLACAVLGAIGVFLHLDGNVEWELEGTPDRQGWPLYWAALRGAVPTLAPGALAQLGLLGLLYSYRHPAITTAGTSASSHQESA